MDISPGALFPVKVTLQSTVENQKICGAICALELPLLLLFPSEGSQPDSGAAFLICWKVVSVWSEDPAFHFFQGTLWTRGTLWQDTLNLFKLAEGKSNPSYSYKATGQAFCCCNIKCEAKQAPNMMWVKILPSQYRSELIIVVRCCQRKLDAGSTSPATRTRTWEISHPSNLIA